MPEQQDRSKWVLMDPNGIIAMQKRYEARIEHQKEIIARMHDLINELERRAVRLEDENVQLENYAATLEDPVQ